MLYGISWDEYDAPDAWSRNNVTLDDLSDILIDNFPKSEIADMVRDYIEGEDITVSDWDDDDEMYELFMNDDHIWRAVCKAAKAYGDEHPYDKIRDLYNERHE